MLQKPLFKRTFSLLFIIGATDYFSNTFYLYWTVWWMDILMHFASGICVGMASVLILTHYFNQKIKPSTVINLSIFLVFLVGIAWEVFEFYFDTSFPSEGEGYLKDTLVDLILDMIGGVLGVIYSQRFIPLGKSHE